MTLEQYLLTEMAVGEVEHRLRMSADHSDPDNPGKIVITITPLNDTFDNMVSFVVKGNTLTND